MSDRRHPTTESGKRAQRSAARAILKVDRRLGRTSDPTVIRLSQEQPVNWLDWEPEQRTFTAHVIWRWTGALVQDVVRFIIRRPRRW